MKILYLILSLLIIAPMSSFGADGTPAPQKENAHVLTLVLDIVQKVASLRGLDPKIEEGRLPFDSEFVSKAHVKKYVLERFKEDYTDAEIADEEFFLKRLGLLPRGSDYKQIVVDFLLKELGGYYDPPSKSLALADWTPVEYQQPVIAHEAVHALQDAHFDLSQHLERDHHNDDKTIAKQAVIEGDATYTMYLYQLESLGFKVDHANPEAMQEFDKLLATQMRVMEMPSKKDNTPKFIRTMSYFPYLEGLKFIARIRKDGGGWEKINSLFTQFPSNTAAIFFPEKYLGHKLKPVQVGALQRVAGKKWNLRTHNVWGMLGCRVLLAQYENDINSAQACNDWQADRYGIFHSKQGGTKIIHQWRWLDRKAAAKFAQVLRRHMSKVDQAPEVAIDIKIDGTRVNLIAQTAIQSS